MADFIVHDSNYQKRVSDSFAKQTALKTIGAELRRIAPGEVDVALPFRSDLAQQHGFIHAGIITTIVDSACGYAALTLMPAETEVLTVEYKANFMSPAVGDYFLARGKVLKPGKTLSVCYGEVMAVKDGQEKVIVTMLATMTNVQYLTGFDIRLKSRGDFPG